MLRVLLSSILIVSECSNKTWGFWNSKGCGEGRKHMCSKRWVSAHSLILGAWQRASNGSGWAHDGGHCSKHLHARSHCIRQLSWRKHLQTPLHLPGKKQVNPAGQTTAQGFAFVSISQNEAVSDLDQLNSCEIRNMSKTGIHLQLIWVSNNHRTCRMHIQWSHLDKHWLHRATYTIQFNPTPAHPGVATA